METKSLLDYLTDLPNRVTLYNFLTDKINDAAAKNKKFHILLLDMDGFKKINDKYGHEAGDKLIKDFVEVFNKETNREMDFLARYGGDEFVIVTERHEYLKMAQNIRKKIRGHVFNYYDDRKKRMYYYKLSVSIGAASYPKDGIDIRTLLLNVDKALYYSKANGRNRITVYKNLMASRIVKFLRTLAYFCCIFIITIMAFIIFDIPKPKITNMILPSYDTVYLNDGTKIEGTILMMSEEDIMIKQVKPKKELLTFKRSKVKSIDSMKK